MYEQVEGPIARLKGPVDIFFFFYIVTGSLRLIQWQKIILTCKFPLKPKCIIVGISLPAAEIYRVSLGMPIPKSTQLLISNSWLVVCCTYVEWTDLYII